MSDAAKGWVWAVVALLAITGLPAATLAGLWAAVGPLVILATCAGLAAGSYHSR